MNYIASTRNHEEFSLGPPNSRTASKELYLEEMRQSTTFADEFAIRAICQMYGTYITVCSNHNSDQLAVQNYGVGTGGEPYIIVNYNNEHFEATEPVSNIWKRM